MTNSDDWPARFRAVAAGPKRKEMYGRYLRSSRWQATRKAALDRAENACQTCNATASLQVHHRTYERVGEERAADLIVLCDGCHSLFHGKRGTRRPQRSYASVSAVERAVRSAVAPVGAGDDFTTGLIVNRLGGEYSAARVATALRRMVESGDVIKLSKRRWQVPVRVPGGRAASVLAVAQVLEFSPPMTTKQIRRATRLSKARVDGAIGSLNLRKEIENVDGGWRATPRLHGFLAGRQRA